uniref:Temptin Cys/Cys disulfide domain-containing protein n=1 Tax=Biomphalaria glabrata TaxID=6526 RepID=A0A2C9L425_BIOGL
MGALKLTLLSFMLLTVASGHPRFRNLIPNGDQVIFLNGPWPGVGHTNRGGGGELNPFGVDFRNNNFQGLEIRNSTLQVLRRWMYEHGTVII